jgi:protein gp37
MPNGERAICYAKDVALGVAQAFYPHGFEHHYTHPDRIDEPFRAKHPARIFVDSMSDMFGHWVPAADIDLMCDAMDAARWHTFLSLTKNAPRLLQMARFPKNLHVGVSAPPDHMWGHALSPQGKAKMLPLSSDIAPILAEYPSALEWIVIGAATNGAQRFMPDAQHLANLLAECDAQMIPVFFKGNLAGHPAASPWREFYPGYVPSPWNTAPSPSTLQPSGVGHAY